MDEQRTYAAWFYSQSPQRRKELTAKGLHPDTYHTAIGSCRSLDRLVSQYGKPDSDPLLLSYDPALLAYLNDGQVDDASPSIPRTAFIECLRYVMTGFLMTKDKDILSHNLAVQSALSLTTEPQSDIARRLGMTPAAFNFRVRKLQKRLGLPSHRNEDHRARQSIGVMKSWSSRTKGIRSPQSKSRTPPPPHKGIT